jgi:osmotically-inducible protein OsmY
VRAAGALRTGAIKAALLAETSLDVSDVDVDTIESAKRVILKGRVRSEAAKTAVERIAAAKAPGYTIDNQLRLR